MCLQNPVIPSASRYVIYSAKGICFIDVPDANSLWPHETKKKRNEYCPIFLLLQDNHLDVRYKPCKKIDLF